MASSAAPAPSIDLPPLQTRGVAARARIETWLEAERDQLALWVPVAIGAGIAAWFMLPDPRAWTAFALACGAVAALALAIGQGGRASRALAAGALLAAAGLALVWWRAERVAAPVLARPAIAMFEGRVERVEPLPALRLVRVLIAPTRVVPREGRAPPDLPPRVRVNLPADDAPAGLAAGARLRVSARLMPPAAPSLPGAYDFARAAWFDRIGATGRGFDATLLSGAAEAGPGLRDRLSAHIHARLPGSAGGIAAALATGDTGAIEEADNVAMRRAGLAHLLSVSGLHITAVVGLVMIATLRLLALSPWAALRWRLPLIAAGTAAVAAIGYTLLTGSQVPTIRSCVAALMVLAALALGREAVTLRLVAVGALVVLVAWPESLAGPSFQLSFAAVTAIVALHETPWARRWLVSPGEAWGRRTLRGLAGLLATGIAVELTLMPIAVYHFHQAGLYGALANIVAIPLTTFVVMPLEAIALLLDVAGWGAPFWWLTGRAMAALLWLAHLVAAAPGSVAALPAMPDGAYAAMVAGGLWLALWRTKWRRLGLVPVALGAGWALATPPPDLLVTGDGRHVAVRTADGGLAMLRDRAGDYTRSLLATAGGLDGEPALLAERADARCSRDLCITDLRAGGRRWRVLATRSGYLVPAADLAAACRASDIVVSERRLPRGCVPRWLRLDRPVLARTGGMAVTLATGGVTTVRRVGDAHPWRR